MLTPRNSYARATRDPKGPFRPRIVKSKKNVLPRKQKHKKEHLQKEN